MSKLPAGYTELTYIHSTGTQYIDMGFKATENTKIEVKFHNEQSANSAVFGADKAWTQDAFGIWINSTIAVPVVGTVSGTIAVSYSSAYDTFTLDKNTLKLNGGTIWTASGVSAFQTPTNVCLGAVNRSGTVSEKFVGRMYYCKVWENGTLIRDFIPALRNYDEVGMYDLVNNAFYGNAGTGAFAEGTRKVQLPEGYTQVEYLMSTGIQYINTGFTPNSNSRVRADIEYVRVNGSVAPFMTRKSSGTNMFGVFNISGTLRSDYGSEKVSFPTSLSTLQRLTYDRNKNVCTVGPETVTNKAVTFNALYPLYLFSSDDDNASKYPSHMKMYYCQIWDNDVLVRYLIPCYNSDRVAGMYDIQNDVFYENAGTGAFITGPAKTALPSGYTQVDCLISSGTQYVDTGVTVNKADSVRMVLDTRLINNNNYAGCNGYMQFQASIGSGARAIIDVNYNNITETILINGVQKSSQGWSSYNGVDVKLGIFRMGDINNGWFDGTPQTGTLYSCKIYENNVVTHDFIPCINVAGVAGLYDLVNSQFYANAGTGTFTAGYAVTWGSADGPNAPSSIEITTLSDSTAKVQWSNVNEATGYQLCINGSLVADTTSTEYVFSTIPFSTYTFSVLAYNDDGKSDTIKTSYSTIPENPCLWLVYDRTQADADRVQQMIQAGYQGLSLEQYTEWASLISKGSWNYTDANRVGAAINLIRNLLADSGLNMSNVLPAPTVYNTESDIRVEDVTQLQESIRQLQQAFETNPTIVVMVPGPNWKYTQANQLEQNLHILYEAIKPYYVWPNAHDALCGGDYL